MMNADPPLDSTIILLLFSSFILGRGWFYPPLWNFSANFSMLILELVLEAPYLSHFRLLDPPWSLLFCWGDGGDCTSGNPCTILSLCRELSSGLLAVFIWEGEEDWARPGKSCESSSSVKFRALQNPQNSVIPDNG